MSAIALGFPLHGCLRAQTKINKQSGRCERKRLPWLDNVEQHRICNALPYIEGIRAFELGDPYRIKVIQRVRIPT